MNRSSMPKQIMPESGPVVPSKEEFEAMSPKEKAARKKKATMQNINLSPKEKMDKEKKEMKGMKKMNMGGMAGAPQSGPKKPMMPPKRKPAPRPTPVVDPMAKAPNPRMKDPREKGSAMPMMKKGGDVKGYDKGGKVRGYGMARGGKVCKMR